MSSSSSNELVVSFPARGSLTLTALQRGKPGIEAYDSYMCLHYGKSRGPLLHAPHHPEELCGAPLDQHPEELCTIDSLDLFLEHSFRLLIGMNYSHILSYTATASARALPSNRLDHVQGIVSSRNT